MKIFFKENTNFLYEIIIGLCSKTGSDKTMANEEIKVFFKFFCFTQSVSIKVSYKVYSTAKEFEKNKGGHMGGIGGC